MVNKIKDVIPESITGPAIVYYETDWLKKWTQKIKYMTRENIQINANKNKMTLIKSSCELFSWACKFLFRPGTTRRYTCP